MPKFFVTKDTRAIARLTLSDAIVRTGYQVGKSPVLTLFAFSLGAEEVLLALIASISTVIGLFFKPLFGFLSDQFGHRLWLLIGAVIFAIAPILYWFVDDPLDLIAVRLVHGTATAIYGPVTLAYIAQLNDSRRATKFGTFSVGRSLGYVVGPLLGALLIVRFDPQIIYTMIGASSVLAFILCAGLDEPRCNKTIRSSIPIFASFRQVATEGTIWIVSAIESLLLIPLYAMKIFLPIAAVERGTDIVAVGLFFSIIAVTEMISKATIGFVADVVGRTNLLACGLVISSGAVLAVGSIAEHFETLLVCGVFFGTGAGIVSPCASAVLSSALPAKLAGSAFGIAGAMRNLSKIFGPLVVAGSLAWGFELDSMLLIFGGVMLFFGIALVPLLSRTFLEKRRP